MNEYIESMKIMLEKGKKQERQRILKIIDGIDTKIPEGEEPDSMTVMEQCDDNFGKLTKWIHKQMECAGESVKSQLKSKIEVKP